MNRSPWAVLAAAIALAACGGNEQKAEEVRPVRVLRIAAAVAADETGYSGEVRARFETRLAFRVPGKMVSRHVEVGQEVKRGQLLARLDARDLRLSEAALQAQAVAARADYELAASDLKRYEELRGKNFISAAEYERRASALNTARARLDQASAQLDQGGNQASYAVLAADADGVITALEAEAGQVVAAGQTVARLARLDEKEAVISVPEHRVDELRRAERIEVRLWANPDRPLAGRLREIAPATDPVTRTYTAKISLPGASGDVRLGMTAAVAARNRDAAERIRIPLSALHERERAPAVWIVDAGKLTVSQVPVRVGAYSGNQVVVDGGLEPGQLVVTAGAHLLRPGQKVRLLDGAR